MSKKTVKLKLSKATAECINASASKEVRMFAASGKLPVEAKELVVALYYLAHDKDPDVKTEARKSLVEFPQASLTPILSSPETHPKVLDYLSRLNAGNDAIEKLIIQNSTTEPVTIGRIAETADEKLLNLIGDSLDRIRENPELVESINKNPHVTAELREKLNAAITDQNKEEKEEEDASSETASESESEESTDEKAGEEETTEDEEMDADSVYKQILEMGVSQKIKFAITGNKEARSILVKDPNRLVCSNVMKNPRLTESEVVLYSSSKSVSEEVFRMIDKNRDWMRSYQIKLNLVSNARVPVPIAMKYINHVRDKDLEILAKSRNVPRAISNFARQLLVKKREKK
jgi:hypothetical protein